MTQQKTYKVLGIDPSDDYMTKVARAIRKEVFYDEPTVNKYFSTLLECFDTDAIKVEVDKKATDSDIKLVAAMGHGDDDKFKGDSGDIIWEKGNLDKTHFDNKIVHLLSCRAGADLGKEIVKSGAKAFYGYRQEFTFHADPGATDASQDRRSMPIFYMDALIDIMILEGKNADEIMRELDTFVQNKIYDLRHKDPDVCGALLVTYAALVNPHRNSSVDDWGDPLVTIDSI